jgi:hypothetical protein
MIINFEMKKIFGGEAKQNPPDLDSNGKFEFYFLNLK